MPQDFGYYSQYVLYISIIPVVLSLRLDLASVQAKDKIEQMLILRKCMRYILSLALVLYAGVLFFLSGFEVLSMGLLVVSSSMLIALQNVAMYYANYKEDYNVIAKSKILLPTLIFIFTASLSILVDGYALILGHAIALFFCSIWFAWAAGLFKENWTFVSVEGFCHSKYKSYYIFDLPATLLNIASLHAPAYLILYFYGPAQSGLYFMAFKLLAAPVSLLTSSVGMVYRRDATKEYLEYNDFRVIFNKTFKVVFFLSSILMLAGFNLTSFLVVPLLGVEWLGVDEIILILLPMFCLKLIASPLSYSFYIVDRLEYDFIGQILFFMVMLLALWFPSVEGDFTLSLYLLSLGSSIIYILYFLLSFKLSRGL